MASSEDKKRKGDAVGRAFSDLSLALEDLNNPVAVLCMGCSAWVQEYTALGQAPKWVRDHTGFTKYDILTGQQVTIRNKEAEIRVKSDTLQLNILKIPQLGGDHHREKEASGVFVQRCAKGQTQVCLVNNLTNTAHQLSKNHGWGLSFQDVRFMVKHEYDGVYIRVGSVGTGRVSLRNPRVGVGGSADALPPPVLLKRYETRYLVEGSILAIDDQKFTVKRVQKADSRKFFEPSLDAEGKQQFRPSLDAQGKPRLDEKNKPFMIAIWTQGDKGKPKTASAPKRLWATSDNKYFEALSKTGDLVKVSLGKSRFTVNPANSATQKLPTMMHGFSMT